MTDIERIEKLIELQNLFNRKMEINNLYKEEEQKRDKLIADTESLIQTKGDIQINYNEMNKKINEEIGKRDEINKRIESLEEGKNKIKIARQLKSWEKEMERMQQELSLIQAQINYDSSKQVEMSNELDRIQAKIQENEEKTRGLQSHIDTIKSEHQGELESIEARHNELYEKFEVQFVDYFESMLVKTKGMAIVELDGDACSGCNIILPTQLQGDMGYHLSAELTKLLQCPHCFRYLYVNKEVEHKEAAL
jgi:hypothetical protein